MTYTVHFTNGTQYVTLNTGEIDDKLGGYPNGKLILIGPSFQNYGELIANNFLHLLENFASDQAPTFPVAGQLWWNTANANVGGQTLNYFDGNKFKPCSSSELGPLPPPSPLDGDQWWNTNTDQLNVFNGNVWMVVGPGYTKGQGISGVYNTIVSDIGSQQHLVSELLLNGNAVAVISNDTTFTLAANISGITDVQPGINLIPTAMLNGTSLNSLRFANSTWSAPSAIGNVSPNSGAFTTLSAISETVGSITLLGNVITSSSSLSINSGNSTITASAVNGTITITQEPTVSGSITTKNYVDVQNDFHLAQANTYTDANVSTLLGTIFGNSITTIGGLSSAINNQPDFWHDTQVALNYKANTFTPTFTGNVLVTDSILPTGNVTSDIGSPTHSFRAVYAATFNSSFADLAEKYDADAKYSVGTVVIFGGQKEITVSGEFCDSRVAGVISENPAYLLNEKSNGLPVALTGKVWCRVVGPVKKGDVLVNSSYAGAATALTIPGRWVPGCTIGKSLEDDDSTNIRDILISVGRF